MPAALGMRLNEVANHSWDVRVAFDPHAGVDGGSAAPVSVAIPGAGLVVDGAVTVADHLESPSATFHGPREAFVRLVSGRLKAPYDEGVTVEGRGGGSRAGRVR